MASIKFCCCYSIPAPQMDKASKQHFIYNENNIEQHLIFSFFPLNDHVFLSRYACLCKRPRDRQETAWSSVANGLYCPLGNTMSTCFSPGKLCPASLPPRRCCRYLLSDTLTDARRLHLERLCCHFGCFAFSSASAIWFNTRDGWQINIDSVLKGDLRPF